MKLVSFEKLVKPVTSQIWCYWNSKISGTSEINESLENRELSETISKHSDTIQPEKCPIEKSSTGSERRGNCVHFCAVRKILPDLIKDAGNCVCSDCNFVKQQPLALGGKT